MLRRLADGGAELIIGGHIHQATAVARRDFEVLDGGSRDCVLATAPGLGRPRPGRRHEVRGVLVHRSDATSLTVETHVWAGEPLRARRVADVPAAASVSARRGRGSPGRAAPRDRPRSATARMKPRMPSIRIPATIAAPTPITIVSQIGIGSRARVDEPSERADRRGRR